MSVKVMGKKSERLIEMRDLPGGKIGEVVGEGHLVQRGNRWAGEPGFVVLGQSNPLSPPCSNGYLANCTRLVRVLKEGETLEVHYS